MLQRSFEKLLMSVLANPLWKTGDELMVKHKANVVDKVVVVTGASGGIGLATAKTFAKFGARVVAACKTESSGKHAVQKIKNLIGDKANVEFAQLDLASFQQIHEFTDQIIQQEGRIDYLILNAAISTCPRMLTREGFEMQWGVNHLGHFHLVQRLLPLMRSQNQEVRIVVVTCSVYKLGKVQFTSPNALQQHYSAADAFKQSKLANAIFGAELSRRLRGTTINVQIVNPGTTDTDINRYIPIFGTALKPFIAPFVQTPAQGSASIVLACVDQSLSKKSGSYIDNLSIKKLNKKATGINAGSALWKISETEVREAKINSHEPQVFDPISILLATLQSTISNLIGQIREGIQQRIQIFGIQ